MRSVEFSEYASSPNKQLLIFW